MDVRLSRSPAAELLEDPAAAGDAGGGEGEGLPAVGGRSTSVEVGAGPVEGGAGDLAADGVVVGDSGREPPTGPPSAPAGGAGGADEWFSAVDPRVPATPSDWARRVGANMSKVAAIAELIEAHGVPVEQYLEEVEVHTRRLLAQGRICVRVPSRNVAALVAGGRLMNQHETGTSGGYVGPMRGGFERGALGVADPTGDPGSAPIYGYASAYLTANPGDGGWVERYGDVVLELRDSLRPRSTWTAGDSLDENQAGFRPTTVASPLNAPSVQSHLFLLEDPGSDFGDEIELRDPLDCDVVDDFSFTYTEVQIWGGVALGDVAAAYVEPGSAAGSTAAGVLRGAGIEVYEL